MKPKTRYNEIGNLQLFKPDYISENKKTLLTSNIIKEFLRKRKGKYYYKVNFTKNKFSNIEKEDNDIINKKMQFRLIEKGYKELKYEIFKRHINEYGFPNNKKLKLLDSNFNFFTTKIKSRNNDTLRNTHKTFLSVNHIFDGFNKFRKTNSEAKMFSLNSTKDLNTNLIDSNFYNISNQNFKKLSPLSKDVINKIKEKNKIKNMFKNNTFKETGLTERNYYSNYNDISNEIRKSFANNNIKNKLTTLNDNKNKSIDNPYFSMNNEHELKLIMKYNFFKVGNEDDENLPINKFKRFKKILHNPKKVRTKNKFHINYVQYIIDNIRRKENTKPRNENNKSNHIFKRKKLNITNDEILNNISKKMLKSFNGSII